MKNGKLRRILLAFSAVLCLTLSIPAAAHAAQSDDFTVKIVHTNDIHARVQEDEKSGIIGMERLAGMIDSFTAGSDIDLVLDSGDMFHGQPIATLAQGESIAELAKACGYDAMTAGNHDWSYGKDKLKQLCRDADITMLTGNVVTENGNKFFDDEFYTENIKIDGRELKVGIFGVIDHSLKSGTTPSNVEGLEFTDETAYANAAAAELRKQDCDIVIALSHTLHPDKLAEKVSGVDLWLVGHEHVTMDKTVKDAAGKDVRVIESGYYLYSASLIEITGTLDSSGNASDIKISASSVDYDKAKAYPKKQQITDILSKINAQQAVKLNEKVGSTPVALDGVWEHLRMAQTNLGNVVADAYLLATGADIAFENAGGIRASVDAGDVTYGDIIGVSPYGNYVVTKQLTGAQIKDIVEESLDIQHDCIAADKLGEGADWPASSGSYLQFGGMTVKYDPDAQKGKRVISIEIQGAPLDESRKYTAAINNHEASSDTYEALKNAAETGQFNACDEILVNFFKQDESKIKQSTDSQRLIAAKAAADDTNTDKMPFSDVSEKDWFYEPVNYVYDNELFTGVSDDTFAPRGALTRAMIVTVLWRAEGKPVVNYAMQFDDIDESGYYAEALRWAASEGIINGITDKMFMPNRNVTRQQMASIVYRYAKAKGVAPQGAWAIQLGYVDIDAIGDWAVEAIMFCKLNNIMQGDDLNMFRPAEPVTRAEAAAVVQRTAEDLAAMN